MPRNRIKGITVEIGGDVTKLDKALAGVNKNISTTQSKLKDVERLLKLDPTNVELLEQKQRLLAQSVEATSDKLKTLKDVAEKSTVSNVKYEEWQKAFKPLQSEITKTTNALAKLETQQRKLEDLGFAPDSSAMAESNRQIEAARQKLDQLEQTVTNTYEAMGRPISIEQWDAIQRELGETANDAERAQDAFDNFSPALSRFGAAAQGIADKADQVANATRGISLAAGGLLTAMLGTVPATEEFRSDLSKLETNAQLAGVGVESTESALKQLNTVSDETDSSVEALSNLLAAGVSENNLQQAVESLAGAAIKFPDTVKIESLADSLQETLATGEATGQFAEVLDRLGVKAGDFNNALAQVPGEANKLNFALDILANEGLNDVYTKWLDNNEALVASKDATFDFKQSLADLADQMTPLMTTVTNLASAFLDWFNGLSDGQQGAIVALVAITAAISPVANAISAVGSAVNLVTKNFGALKTGISAVFKLFATNPILAGILAIVAGIALLILNWDKVKETVKNVIDAVVGFIQKAIDAVKSFFAVLSGGEQQVQNAAPGSSRSAANAPSTASLDDYPHFASGGVFAPNNPMLAVLGDNRTEYEIAAPQSAIRDTVLEALDMSGAIGGAQTVNVYVRFTGSLSQVGRLLAPSITAETVRQGTPLGGPPR